MSAALRKLNARKLRGLQPVRTMLSAKVWLRNSFVPAIHNPRVNDKMILVASMVAYMSKFPGPTRLAEVCRVFDLTERQAQRLFRYYVGVGMKWVMVRARMHEGIERVRVTGKAAAAAAYELGYYDQAQLIHDFHRLTGESPQKYSSNR
jgi:AraC-like DNA-binding protein